MKIQIKLNLHSSQSESKTKIILTAELHVNECLLFLAVTGQYSLLVPSKASQGDAGMAFHFHGKACANRLGIRTQKVRCNVLHIY